MAVTNLNDALTQNLRILAEWRVNHQTWTVDGSDVIVVPVEGAPVQYVNLSGTSNAIRLPLAAKNGTMFIVTNNASDANVLLVTDDAGSPVTIATLAADTGGLFMKKDAAYVCLLESAAIA